MIGFQLGREFKLSVAEILTVFPEWKTVFFDNTMLILDNIEKEEVLKKANNLWWTIKIIEIIDESILDIALKSEWKFKYWLSIFWDKKSLKEELNNLKKSLKEKSISSRFVNKDFKNLSSAQITGEFLVRKSTDFSYIYENETKYIWRSIWIQDIYSYSKRDYAKDRDMQTGMLPPKLCQMMINISEGKNIYDPFVWLGTLLIESILMGNKNVFWSDLNDKMVESSENNIINFAKENNIELWKTSFIKLNAKFIDESTILKENDIDSIVTEWYLWEIMTKKNISIERIAKQKESLISIYIKFFENLQKTWFKWNLVICFPFWEINGKYFYFEEIYSIIDRFCEVEKIYNNFEDLTTKAWSLLYKREKQLVWREIFKLKIKD